MTICFSPQLDGGKVSLHVRRISAAKFAKYGFIDEILGFPGIYYRREINSWLISYEIFDAKTNQAETPTIVTFEDAIRYRQRINFEQDLSHDLFIEFNEIHLMIH